jgi:phytoene synthase
MNSSTPAPNHPALGTSLYYALRCAPQPQRVSLTVWLQWWHEIAQIPLNVSDPGVAETKLRWWTHELQSCRQGQASHPITKALSNTFQDTDAASDRVWQLALEQVDALIDLVHQTRWMDQATLRRHQTGSTGAATEAVALLLGVSSAQGASWARQLGVGLRQSHQLARLGQDARAGWMHVPIDVLQNHDVRAHQISKPQLGQTPPGWPALLSHLVLLAQTDLLQALTGIRALPSPERSALKPLIALAHMHLALLEALSASGDTVLHQRLMLTPLRKWWITQKVRWGLLR